MGPLPYMRSVVEQNVVMRRMPVPANADRREREREGERHRNVFNDATNCYRYIQSMIYERKKCITQCYWSDFDSGRTK